MLRRPSGDPRRRPRYPGQFSREDDITDDITGRMGGSGSLREFPLMRRDRMNGAPKMILWVGHPPLHIMILWEGHPPLGGSMARLASGSPQAFRSQFPIGVAGFFLNG